MPALNDKSSAMNTKPDSYPFAKEKSGFDSGPNSHAHLANKASQPQTTHHTADQDEYRKAEVAPQSARQALSSAPASAAAVSSIMGPPPPKEEKMSCWKRWKRDRQESRELRKLGMPSHSSDRRWKVGQIV